MNDPTFGGVESITESLLTQVNANLPRVTEYTFQREVADILERVATDPNALQTYQQYVGELTMELLVVDNNDQSKILFKVPALIQRPATTLPDPNASKTMDIISRLSLMSERGDKTTHQIFKTYLERIAVTPDYKEAVGRPINKILGKYDKKFYDDGEIPDQGPGSVNDDFED